jgi:hypothetical protein
LLFAGDDYYPRGGWNDYKGSYATFVEASAAGRAMLGKSMDWYHIVFDRQIVEWG